MPKEVLSYVLATALIFPEHAAVVEEYFAVLNIMMIQIHTA